MTTFKQQPAPPAPTIAVLSGGTSSERAVSLRSGAACHDALRIAFPHHPIELHQIDTNALPANPPLDPRRHVVFSTLHGTFGEDGGMQRLLEAASIAYAGCDSFSSALTMDKTATKLAASAAGVPTIPGLTFNAATPPEIPALLATFGPTSPSPTSPKSPTSPSPIPLPPLPVGAAERSEVAASSPSPLPSPLPTPHFPHLVLKPNAEGSSIGLHIITTPDELTAALADARAAGGTWLLERRIHGRELAVGVLNGRAMGIVEIRPKTGVYDYASKYTPGATDYLAPAPLDAPLAARIRAHAETAFAACRCRDFARVDFMLSNEPVDTAACVSHSEIRNPKSAFQKVLLIEINTLPGMTATSLLPKSAACIGLDFPSLVREMLLPAIARFHATQ